MTAYYVSIIVLTAFGILGVLAGTWITTRAVRAATGGGPVGSARWRHRYMVAIVGHESGNVTALPFVTFRHYDQAQDWCDHMNDAHERVHPRKLTSFQVRRRDWQPGDDTEHDQVCVHWPNPCICDDDRPPRR